jgi:4-cresol dehydrogenase (hydroxylating) flavoprotein subunit
MERALNAFREALGPQGVLTGATEVAEFRDPFSHASWQEFAPSAVLMPSCVEDVQAVLRIANAHRTPVWTSSQGRNNGYGGPAPRVGGGIVLSLRRMNRVLEINEESGYAVVEPGVRFFDLYDALRAARSRLWMSVPDLGWGSVVGNTLDHGMGYTPFGDHPLSQCGMEVVLPNGELLRTGMGAMSNTKAWHIYKRGFGPSADGLFMQSNFGIVTKMGVWLMPAPECYMPGWLTLRRDEDIELLLERLRPLMQDGTIANQPMIINAVCAASALSGREDWYQGQGAIPADVIERIASQPGLGHWVMRFALYGDERIVERQREIVSAALLSIPGATLDFSKYDGRNLPVLDNPHERVQAGIPSMDLDRMTRWYGGEQGGHIGFSCASPLTGRDASALRSLVRTQLNGVGLDYSGVFVVGKRSMIHICLVVFDTRNEPQARLAYDACKALVRPAAQLGYGEYRAHLDFMDLVADQYDFNDHAQLRFNETIKDALDPNGILSPGKQGIWPAAYRKREV